MVVLTIAIVMDLYPVETSWKLLDEDSVLIDERLPGFYFRAYATELTTVIVAGGAGYTFLIADTFGDGIIGGDARIYLGFPDDTPLAYTDGTFGSLATLPFVASMANTITVPALPAPTPENASPPTLAPFAPNLPPAAPTSPTVGTQAVDLGLSGCSSTSQCGECQGTIVQRLFVCRFRRKLVLTLTDVLALFLSPSSFLCYSRRL